MRKNFKARMTAKNMNITEYNKETLIRLMIFASQIGELNSNEAKRTIELSRKWEITNLSKINSVRSLKRLKETGWLEQQDISDYIAILVDILSQSDFFDIQQTLISMLNQYALDYKDLEPEALPDVLKEIRFSNVDFSNQFYGNNGKREISQSEKYANFMYLSNQLAHAFCANVVGMQNWQTNHLVQELFKIKIWCVHKLIEEKSHGALMDVSIRKIQTGDEGNFPNCIISFSIPNYMEPFSVHMNDGCLSKEELAQCDGIDRYNLLGLRTSFPQYLSDEKMKLLEHLYEDKFQKATYKRGKNLQWLFETKAILQEKEQKKILWAIVLLTSTTTALVGPMMFFGFMMSNLAYLLIKEYQHKWLFSVAILLSFLSLTTGQILVERVFQLQINVSMVIELVGGLFFFYLLAKEAKR